MYQDNGSENVTAISVSKDVVSVTIPHTVTYGEKTYKVKSVKICDHSNYKLEHVVIKKGIEKIEKLKLRKIPLIIVRAL